MSANSKEKARMIQVLQARQVFAADGLSERAADYLIGLGYWNPIDLEGTWADSRDEGSSANAKLTASSDSDREMLDEIQNYRMLWPTRLPERHFLLSHKFRGSISHQAMALPNALAMIIRVESARAEFILVNGLSASAADFLIGLGYWPSAVTYLYDENGPEWESMGHRIASSPDCDPTMLEEIQEYCEGWTKVRPISVTAN